jgi:hypothetical protein
MLKKTYCWRQYLPYSMARWELEWLAPPEDLLKAA